MSGCFYHDGRYYGYDDVPQTDEPVREEEEYSGEPVDWDEWRRHVEEDL